MPGKLDALSILFVLLPGFLCAYIAQGLAVRRQQSDTEKVIEALIFSLVLYLVTLPHFGFSLPLNWQAGMDGSYKIVANYRHLLALFLLSLALGTAYAANINHDWLMGLMRWLHVTERTAWIDGLEREEIEGPGILLTSGAGINTITFLGSSEDETEAQSSEGLPSEGLPTTL